MFDLKGNWLLKNNIPFACDNFLTKVFLVNYCFIARAEFWTVRSFS